MGAKDMKGTDAEQNFIEVIPGKSGRKGSEPLASVTDAVDALLELRERGLVAAGSGRRVFVDGRTNLTYAEANMVRRQAADAFNARKYAGTTAIRWVGAGKVSTSDKSRHKEMAWGAWVAYKG